MSDYEDLLDYRRRVAEMYARARGNHSDPAARCLEFRRACEDASDSPAVGAVR